MRRLLRRYRAFTLVELLAVIAIMGLLVGMVVAASTVVVRKQKVRTTRDVLLKLDQILEEYLAQRNTPPGFVAEQYEDVPGPRGLSSFRGDMYPDRPDASVFLANAKGVGECDVLIASIPERFLVTTIGDGLGSSTLVANDPTPSVLDSWGELPWRPSEDGDGWSLKTQSVVYYVHPDNHLAQAVYGRCLNKRPYFLSPGPDGLYGHPEELEGVTLTDVETEESKLAEWRSDNVYSYEGIDVSFEITSDAKSAVGN